MNFETDNRTILVCPGSCFMSIETSEPHYVGNGHVERFDRILGNMVRALPQRSKEKWSQLLQTLTFAYNCTAHESTNISRGAISRTAETIKIVALLSLASSEVTAQPAQSRCRFPQQCWCQHKRVVSTGFCKLQLTPFEQHTLLG